MMMLLVEREHHSKRYMSHCLLRVPTPKMMQLLWILVPHHGHVNLVNTCPIDNFLTIFYVLMKKHGEFYQLLSRSAELYATALIRICQLFDEGKFVDGKCEWLKLYAGRFNLTNAFELDLWGCEEDLFVSRLYSALETTFTSTCSSPYCSSGVKQVCSKAITLR
jgi:hypothetical protein